MSQYMPRSPVESPLALKSGIWAAWIQVSFPSPPMSASTSWGIPLSMTLLSLSRMRSAISLVEKSKSVFPLTSSGLMPTPRAKLALHERYTEFLSLMKIFWGIFSIRVLRRVSLSFLVRVSSRCILNRFMDRRMARSFVIADPGFMGYPRTTRLRPCRFPA